LTETTYSEFFAGVPVAKPVGQSYTIFANGTVTASDEEGSSMAIRPLTGFPSSTTVTMEANSTTAIQNYLAIQNGQTIVNVTVTYSMMHQFCYPSGLEMTVSGAVDWGASQSGTIGLPFGSPLISATTDGAWFGNQSGVALGIDWSNSLNYSPVYNGDSNALTYSVGPSFRIDPSIVATSSGEDYALASPAERTSFYGDGLYWVFFISYLSGSALLYYTTSGNGQTWATATEVSSTVVTGGYSVWFDGIYVYYVLSGTYSSASYLYNRAGTISNTGLISWVQTQQMGATGYGGILYPTVITDSNDYEWIGIFAQYQYTGSSYISCGYALKSSTTGGIWTLASGFPYETQCDSSSSYFPGGTEDLVQLANGAIVAITAASGSNWAFQAWTGSSWESTVTSSMYDFGEFTAVAYGNNVAVAAQGGGSSSNYDLVYEFYSYSTNSVSASFEKTMASEFYDSPTLSVDQTTGTLYVFLDTLTSPYTVSYMKYTSAWGYQGGWGAVSVLFSGGSYISYAYLDSSYSNSGDMIGLTLTSSYGLSPYTEDVLFSAIPAPIPTAATSSNSWGKPGISPYESYFQDNTEYVSPGNGLLGINAVDLEIAGRGLNLTIGRVFSTPYAFDSSSPYQYDNYTLTNLGYGWSLDFPWMGSNYLHLADGQAYPYDWTGNTFQYNEATNFELVNNSGSYSLYLADGTTYQFNSAKELTSMTDSTGNNTISFSYGSNNYISTITDTISRTVTFSYNSNNTLSSISSGGRTVYYYYHGYDLSSVKDAVGDITDYQYSTGINSWLISAVLYPTGGKTTYTYGSSPVGTEVRTYYVTARNVYSSTGGSGGVLALDGTTHCSSTTSNTCNMVLTTSNPNDVIIVVQAAESSGGVGQFAAVTDTGSLTWHNRAQVCSWTSGSCSGDGGSGTPSSVSEDYAIASSPLSSDTITCKQTGNTNSLISCVAFGISGANTAAPFDTHSGLPCAGESGNGVTGTSFSCTLSTSNADDMILGVSASSAGSGSITLGSGFSTAKCNFPDNYGNACAEEKVVSSTQSSLSVGMTSGVSATWAFIGDAIVAASGTGGTLSQSDSSSYTLVNGNVVWSNTTIAGGGSTQSVQKYYFYQGYKPYMKLYNENSTSSIVTVTESTFDSSGRINDTMVSSSLAYDLVAYWPLDEGSGSTTTDASGNGNSGTLMNSPTWETSSSCKYVDCLSFVSTSSQYVAVATPTSTIKGAFTVSMWLYPNSLSTTNVFFNTIGNTANANVVLFLDNRRVHYD